MRYMQNHIKKKTSFIKLFRKEFTIILSIFTIGMITVILTNKDIKTIILAISGKIVPIVIISTFIISIYFYGYLFVEYIIYLHRHLYVPLSKEELRQYDITSLREYLVFLREFFNGKTPLKRVQNAIIESVKQNLLEPELEHSCNIANLSLFKKRLFSSWICDSKKFDVFGIIISIITAFVLIVIIPIVSNKVISTFYKVSIVVLLYPIFYFCYHKYKFHYVKKLNWYKDIKFYWYRPGNLFDYKNRDLEYKWYSSEDTNTDWCIDEDEIEL